MGRQNTKEESHAVHILQERLHTLQTHWVLLPTNLMARPSPFSPPSGYGPFVFGQETVLGGNPHFGRQTDLAVRKFQKQVNIEEDGKAGFNTLGKLNERIAAIEKALQQKSGKS
jgi:peptidoglycan hydrolase-like protein with peptidoglycan-binding domain